MRCDAAVFIFIYLFIFHLFLHSTRITHNSWFVFRSAFAFIIASLSLGYFFCFPFPTYIFRMKISPFDYIFIQFNFLARARSVLFLLSSFLCVPSPALKTAESHFSTAIRTAPNFWFIANEIYWADETTDERKRRRERERIKRRTKIQFFQYQWMGRRASRREWTNNWIEFDRSSGKSGEKRRSSAILFDVLTESPGVRSHRTDPKIRTLNRQQRKRVYSVVKRKINDKNKERKNTRC